MRYYASLRNLEYTIDEDEVKRYRAKGFTIRPMNPSVAEPSQNDVEEVVPSETVTPEVVIHKKRGRKPKQQSDAE